MRKSAILLLMLVFGASAWAAEAPAPDTMAAANAGRSVFSGEALAFYALALLVGGSALGCVIASSIVRMALCLLGTLGGVALLYFLLAANFLGAIQFIVYAGGTLIVIVFGVMLTTRLYGGKLRPKPLEMGAAAVVCLALFAGLSAILLGTHWGVGEAPGEAQPIAAFGNALLTTYLVPFELASVLLLAVMIGAAYLANPAAKE